MLVVPELHGFYQKIFLELLQPIFILFGTPLMCTSKSNILTSYCVLSLWTQKSKKGVFTFFKLHLLFHFLRFSITFLHSKYSRLIKINKRKQNDQPLGHTYADQRSISFESFFNKSRSYCSSFIWLVIDINMHFECYSYKFMSLAVISRLKLRNFKLLWRLFNTASYV